MSNLFWLNDVQIAHLRPFFPKSHGKPCVDDRCVLSVAKMLARDAVLEPMP